MPLFQCNNCGCVENTATAAIGMNSESMRSCFDWTGIEDRRNFLLCAACGPTEYSNGKPTKFGKWHNVFKRIFLPMGMFVKNNDGNLQHRETGDRNYFNYAITEEESLAAIAATRATTKKD